MKRILTIGGAEFVITAASIQFDQMPAHDGHGQVMLIALPNSMLMIRAQEVEVKEPEECA